jgi:hypothetical protein
LCVLFFFFLLLMVVMKKPVPVQGVETVVDPDQEHRQQHEAERVRASEGLLRAAIAMELFSVTLLIFAALALYQLFKSVDPKTSLLMAVMMLVSVPISYVNALSHIAPLVLLKTP